MWKTLSATYLVESPWISVVAEVCVNGKGTRIDPYYVLEAPDFVHILALTLEQRVVVVKQYRHGYGEAIYELPGGLRDPGDKSAAETASRELAEETGYVAAEYRLLGSFSADPARLRNRLHLVLARDAIPAGLSAPDEQESIEVVAVTPAELFSLMRSGQFANAAHAGLLMAFLLQDPALDAELLTRFAER